ncbi:MAG: hypothetical protein HON51_02995 [Gammaproteobacteria bacterium]|nr:hypothetical protein [Gammaproteobacteria bacterium]MBT5222946.1 hypothetical protein [Gammaproteobacteria bacterium]MBT5826887.1 hypothetical protein [Gammaproteobacteria bacterium]MBT5966828.1 hypothetical protein [Gammaproteobacteria bacterium]MBT6418957.1 hypothetical protein [Gammaproteobacteria bacterium]
MGFTRITQNRTTVEGEKICWERGIWQRHDWEHVIRDGLDYQRHVEYVHVKPFMHGHVKRVEDWPYSTFHQCVA